MKSSLVARVDAACGPDLSGCLLSQFTGLVSRGGLYLLGGSVCAEGDAKGVFGRVVTGWLASGRRLPPLRGSARFRTPTREQFVCDARCWP